jgi:hypothetical protein
MRRDGAPEARVIIAIVDHRDIDAEFLFQFILPALGLRPRAAEDQDAVGTPLL